MKRETLTEAQYATLKWASGPHSVHWGGKIMGAPPRASVNAALRRGWLMRVGERSMDLHALTPAGRQALADREAQDHE